MAEAILQHAIYMRDCLLEFRNKIDNGESLLQVSLEGFDEMLQRYE